MEKVATEMMITGNLGGAVAVFNNLLL